MYTFLLVLLILDSLVVVAAILLQAAKGGGLASSFGGATTASDAFIGTRQASNLLSRLGWWGGGVFLFLSFVLQLMNAGTRVPKSVLDQPLGQAPATAPAAPKPSTNASTAIPLTPVEKAPPATKTTAPATKPPVTKKP
jgi:preprotein translocase subunit SecG